MGVGRVDIGLIIVDYPLQGMGRARGMVFICGGIDHVVQQLFNGGGCHMHPGIG